LSSGGGAFLVKREINFVWEEFGFEFGGKFVLVVLIH
jgi:hypothetical protein